MLTVSINGGAVLISPGNDNNEIESFNDLIQHQMSNVTITRKMTSHKKLLQV